MSDSYAPLAFVAGAILSSRFIVPYPDDEELDPLFVAVWFDAIGPLLTVLGLLVWGWRVRKTWVAVEGVHWKSRFGGGSDLQ